MKKMMTFLKKAKVKAFTLVEMLVVLLIISVLLLLFVPNLTKQKEAVMTKEKLLLLRWWKVRQSFIAWKRMKMLA